MQNSTNNTRQEEERLVQGCKANDRRVQEQVYRRYGPVLFRICLRYGGSREEAEDLLQESFIRIFKSIHSFIPQGSLEGWMKRITVNAALENFRKSGKMSFTEINDTVSQGKEDDTISHLEAAEILSLLQKLPPGFRTVFNLFAIEGFSHKEIAAALGISEGTSKSQFARARQHLQLLCQKNRISAHG